MHMSGIRIVKASITDQETDAVVNAANSHLRMGSGVCGAIFMKAGASLLTEACDAIGHCDTGSAVITEGFRLKARWIIHAVGPVWQGGASGEASLLRSAYLSSLALARSHGCRSIAFPLISAGIYGYPAAEAWAVALGACRDDLAAHPDAELQILFTVLTDAALQLGRDQLRAIAPEWSTDL